jgi:hypothetical protein
MEAENGAQDVAKGFQLSGELDKVAASILGDKVSSALGDKVGGLIVVRVLVHGNHLMIGEDLNPLVAVVVAAPNVVVSRTHNHSVGVSEVNIVHHTVGEFHPAALHLAIFTTVPVLVAFEVDAIRTCAFRVFLVSRPTTEGFMWFANRRAIGMSIEVFTFTFFVPPKAKITITRKKK